MLIRYIYLKFQTSDNGVKNQWFKLDFGDNLEHLLSKVIGEELFSQILHLYKFYLDKIPSIDTSQEGMKISKPIEIIMKHNDNEF